MSQTIRLQSQRRASLMLMRTRDSTAANRVAFTIASSAA
jgi:hypothetical protein